MLNVHRWIYLALFSAGQGRKVGRDFLKKVDKTLQLKLLPMAGPCGMCQLLHDNEIWPQDLARHIRVC